MAFAAIAIGALVPSAIMSIACANIFSRTIYRGFLAPNATNAQESSVAKIASLVVKVGALVFIIFVPVPYALQFQLLGGLWMIQVLPSVILGLYLRMLNGWALLAGWAVGTGVGTWMASTTSFKAAVFTLSFFGRQFPGLHRLVGADRQRGGVDRAVRVAEAVRGTGAGVRGITAAAAGLAVTPPARRPA